MIVEFAVQNDDCTWGHYVARNFPDGVHFQKEDTLWLANFDKLLVRESLFIEEMTEFDKNDMMSIDDLCGAYKITGFSHFYHDTEGYILIVECKEE